MPEETNLMQMWNDGTIVGKQVTLRRKDSEVATVERVYRDTDGGVRLDRKLDGFWSWNVDELKLSR